MTQALPPFTPTVAPPVQPAAPTPSEMIAEHKKRKAKADGVKKVAKKVSKAVDKMLAKNKKGSTPASRKHAQVEAHEPSKRVRSVRVAPLMLDAASALSALAGLGKTDIAAMQAIVRLLNPLSRPARKRVLAAVLALMGN